MLFYRKLSSHDVFLASRFSAANDEVGMGKSPFIYYGKAVGNISYFISLSPRLPLKVIVNILTIVL